MAGGCCAKGVDGAIEEVGFCFYVWDFVFIGTPFGSRLACDGGRGTC